MLLGIGGLMFSTADAQQIYKWVDQQGVTHYSEQSPAGNHAKTIYIHSHRAETHPSQPPALETANDTKEQLSAEQHLASQAQLPTPEQNRVQQQNCATARQELRALENAGRVRQLNPNTGQYIYLADEVKLAQIQQMSDYLRNKCPG